MTKKHFEALARALREEEAPLRVVERVAEELYTVCKNFDDYRFIQACGFTYNRQEWCKAA